MLTHLHEDQPLSLALVLLAVTRALSGEATGHSVHLVTIICSVEPTYKHSVIVENYIEL